MKSKKLLRKKEPSSVDSRLKISGMTDEKISPSEEGDSVFIVIWCGSSSMGVYPVNGNKGEYPLITPPKR